MKLTLLQTTSSLRKRRLLSRGKIGKIDKLLKNQNMKISLCGKKKKKKRKVLKAENKKKEDEKMER